MRHSYREGSFARAEREARKGEHALVIGGSIAGLLAARVLLDHFHRVTMVERDVLPSGPVTRRGAPQAHHNHVLLLRGRQVMEELFPRLQPAIVDDGGLLLDMANELAWLTPWGWGARFVSTLVMLACSRALLEWRIRQQLAALPGVVFAPSTKVTGLVVSRGRVVGVRTGTGELGGDLIVDASGRGSQASRWLEQSGFRPPQETVVNAFLGYASRIYRPSPEAERWWKGMYVQAAPPDHPRVGVILPIEHGLWHVTIGGGFERCFQARLARVNRDPWMLAIADDLRYRATEGASRNLHTRVMHAYMDAIGRMTTYDVSVRVKLLRAFHMIAPPASLFTPSLAWRVLTGRRPVSGSDQDPQLSASPIGAIPTE